MRFVPDDLLHSYSTRTELVDPEVVGGIINLSLIRSHKALRSTTMRVTFCIVCSEIWMASFNNF